MKLFIDRLVIVVKHLSLADQLTHVVILLVLFTLLVFLIKRIILVDGQILSKNDSINRLLHKEKKSLYISIAFLVLSFLCKTISSKILHYYPEYSNPFAIINGTLLVSELLAFAVYLILLARRMDSEDISSKQ